MKKIIPLASRTPSNSLSFPPFFWMGNHNRFAILNIPPPRFPLSFLPSAHKKERRKSAQEEVFGVWVFWAGGGGGLGWPLGTPRAEEEEEEEEETADMAAAAAKGGEEKNPI